MPRCLFGNVGEPAICHCSLGGHKPCSPECVSPGDGLLSTESNPDTSMLKQDSGRLPVPLN